MGARVRRSPCLCLVLATASLCWPSTQHKSMLPSLPPAPGPSMLFGTTSPCQSLQSQVLPLLPEQPNGPWASRQCTIGKLQGSVQVKAPRKLQVLVPIPQSHIYHVYAAVGDWISLIWQCEMASIWFFPGMQEALRLWRWAPAAKSRVKQCLA